MAERKNVKIDIPILEFIQAIVESQPHIPLEAAQQQARAYKEVYDATGKLDHIMDPDVRLALQGHKGERHKFREELAAARILTQDIQTQVLHLKQDYDDFRSTVQDPATALRNFEAAIREELKLQKARQLWDTRANNARNAWIASTTLLAALLIGVPAFILLDAPAILEFMRALGDAALVDTADEATRPELFITAVSRLVLITLPIVLYIWLIRIVVRFNMRSLLLMDDANQRTTMLETYLHLVETDATVKADRPLILEALFRRTPGHGPDTIEPPNLTDVVGLRGRGDIAAN